MGVASGGTGGLAAPWTLALVPQLPPVELVVFSVSSEPPIQCPICELNTGGSPSPPQCSRVRIDSPESQFDPDWEGPKIWRVKPPGDLDTAPI
jgi:hypothetical protein